MYNGGSSPTLTDVTFSDNSASYGGGIFNYDSSPALTDATFSDNAAGADGGGIYNFLSSPTLTGVTFNSNSAVYNGGGIYNEYSDLTLTDVTFSGNSAGLVGSGGGIFNSDDGSMTPTDSRLTLTNVTFSGNSSSSHGGGMHNRGSIATLMDVTFSGNSAFYGGGMRNLSNSVTLTNVTFSGNVAFHYGGGIYNSYNSPTLTNVTFSGNVANISGGGIYNSHNNPTLTNITLNGNSAEENGGGIYNELSHPTIQNSIVWGNRAIAGGDQIYNEESAPAITYSDVEGSGGSGPGWDPGLGSDLGGNLDADPLFVRAGNLRLRWGSPAVDAGDNSLVPPGVTTDLDGAPRFAYGTVDMGAYELQPGLYLYKDAGLAHVAPGQRFTYTLQAANAFTTTAMTGGLISDTLPAGLLFAGPITLDPPGAGLVGVALPILASSLAISPAQIVTVTFPVTVEGNTALGTILTNAAALTSSQVLTPRLASHTIVVVGYYFYLPVIFKGGEP
jgi:uncharacterized repeat protein (TIGR01451 family)